MSGASRAPRSDAVQTPAELVREFCATWEEGRFDGQVVSEDDVRKAQELEQAGFDLH